MTVLDMPVEAPPVAPGAGVQRVSAALAALAGAAAIGGCWLPLANYTAQAPIGGRSTSLVTTAWGLPDTPDTPMDNPLPVWAHALLPVGAVLLVCAIGLLVARRSAGLFGALLLAAAGALVGVLAAIQADTTNVLLTFIGMTTHTGAGLWLLVAGAGLAVAAACCCAWRAHRIERALTGR